jgi:hypothetical protein
MVIDMKGLYVDSIIKIAKKCGFEFIGMDEYNVQKSHYAKKQKKQYLIAFIKK